MEVSKRKCFQYYLKTYFRFPTEIKNDIIYCQRSLKSYIRAHQTVTAYLEQKGNTVDPRTKAEILADIEAEIYEINAEQQYLFIRLRRVIDEFNKMLTRNGIPIDVDATNLNISQQVIPLINEGDAVQPINVTFRRSHKMLMEDVESLCTKKPIQIDISQDDDEVVMIDEPPRKKKQMVNMHKSIPSSATTNVNTNQKSLLKPMSQRIASSKLNAIEKVAENDIKEDIAIEMPVSKDVRMSRLNLRQALKRAHSEANKASSSLQTQAKAPGKIIDTVAKKIQQFTAEVLPNSKNLTTTIKFSAPTGQIKVNEQKSRKITRRCSQAIVATNKSPELTSSSEESNTCQDSTSTCSSNELKETRTLPEEYGKEMFLRLFQLYTPEMRAQMQQRRSKRKRRSVQNNERSDFHYGKIEGETVPAKASKRTSSDKSRSNSRSPTML